MSGDLKTIKESDTQKKRSIFASKSKEFTIAKDREIRNMFNKEHHNSSLLRRLELQDVQKRLQQMTIKQMKY